MYICYYPKWPKCLIYLSKEEFGIHNCCDSILISVLSILLRALESREDFKSLVLIISRYYYFSPFSLIFYGTTLILWLPKLVSLLLTMLPQWEIQASHTRLSIHPYFSERKWCKVNEVLLDKLLLPSSSYDIFYVYILFSLILLSSLWWWWCPIALSIIFVHVGWFVHEYNCRIV